MKLQHKIAAAGGGVALAAGAALTLPGLGLGAADHVDPPSRTDPAVDDTPDRAADIADLYAWHDDDNVNLALTFSGPQATDEPANYDPEVLYTINISNAAPRTTPDIPIQIQFGPGADAGEFGVQVTGIPGTGGPIVGSVETTIEEDGVLVQAGLFDDPFFFDSQGFRETAMTGTLSFDSTRDFFAGQNITGVVIQIPRDRLENAGNVLDIWTTTARLGGQLEAEPMDDDDEEDNDAV